MMEAWEEEGEEQEKQTERQMEEGMRRRQGMGNKSTTTSGNEGPGERKEARRKASGAKLSMANRSRKCNVGRVSEINPA